MQGTEAEPWVRNGPPFLPLSVPQHCGQRDTLVLAALDVRAAGCWRLTPPPSCRTAGARGRRPFGTDLALGVRAGSPGGGGRLAACPCFLEIGNVTLVMSASSACPTNWSWIPMVRSPRTIHPVVLRVTVSGADRAGQWSHLRPPSPFTDGAFPSPSVKLCSGRWRCSRGKRSSWLMSVVCRVTGWSHGDGAERVDVTVGSAGCPGECTHVPMWRSGHACREGCLLHGAGSLGRWRVAARSRGSWTTERPRGRGHVSHGVNPELAVSCAALGGLLSFSSENEGGGTCLGNLVCRLNELMHLWVLEARGSHLSKKLSLAPLSHA